MGKHAKTKEERDERRERWRARDSQMQSDVLTPTAIMVFSFVLMDVCVCVEELTSHLVSIRRQLGLPVDYVTVSGEEYLVEVKNVCHCCHVSYILSLLCLYLVALMIAQEQDKHCPIWLHAHQRHQAGWTLPLAICCRKGQQAS